MADDDVQELKPYKVILNNTPTTVLLTEEDYKSQGWVADPNGGSHAVRGTDASRSHQGGTRLVTAKARTAEQNKAADARAKRARERGETTEGA